MVDEIKITDINIDGDKRDNFMDIEIIVDSPDMDYHNMYDMYFDPHYLVEHHIKSYFPYFDLKNIAMDFIVWGPDENIVYSWKN